MSPCTLVHRARADAWIIEMLRAICATNAEHAAYCAQQAVRELRWSGEQAAWGC